MSERPDPAALDILSDTTPYRYLRKSLAALGVALGKDKDE